jgi:hypothetical protein
MHGEGALGRDKIKIRYLYFHFGRWVWRPTKRMRADGFHRMRLGPGLIVDGKHVPAPTDVARAIELNGEWDRHRRGLPPEGSRLGYPPGSIGDGYHRAMAMREKERQAKGIIWTREHHSRDDWPRAWKRIEPLLGDCDPKTVEPEMLLDLRADIAAQVSEGEAHRTFKVWRALWARMGLLGFCDPKRDPSLFFANSAPKPRQEVWHEGEAVRLVKEAWRSGYRGLAALLGVAWDSQLSPVDARSLKASQMRRDPVGMWFDVARAKTGRAALATLSPRTERLLTAYLERFPAQLMGEARIFRNRSGVPYSKDTLGDDFRDVRAKVFGPGEIRQLADFRRSGAAEALAGNVSPEKRSSKMANTLSQSNFLHNTYAPVQLPSVRDVDAARRVGRARIREQKGDESIRAPDQKYPPERRGGAK